MKTLTLALTALLALIVYCCEIALNAIVIALDAIVDPNN